MYKFLDQHLCESSHKIINSEQHGIIKGIIYLGNDPFSDFVKKVSILFTRHGPFTGQESIICHSNREHKYVLYFQPQYLPM